MTRDQAYRAALVRSKKVDYEVHVIREDGEYAITDDNGLDTYWLGATVVGSFCGGEENWFDA